MLHIKQLVLTLILLGWMVNVQVGMTQNFNIDFYHLQRDDDLLSSSYNCLAQDEYGFMWFGSWDGGGLYRYDGYNLKSFVVDPDDLNSSLTSNRINSVHTPGDGFAYVGTHGGLSIINLITGDIEQWANQVRTLPSIECSYIESICLDQKGSIYVGSLYGLGRIPAERDTMYWLKALESNAGKHPMVILNDRLDENTLWLATEKNLFKYNKQNRIYQRFSPDHNNYFIYDIEFDSDSSLYVATTSGQLFNYDVIKDEWTDMRLSSVVQKEYGEITNLYFSDTGRIWVATSNEVCQFEESTRTASCLSHQPANKDGLFPIGLYRALFGDRHGRLWIASRLGVQFSKDPCALPTLPSKPPQVVCLSYQTNIDLEAEKRPLLIHDSIYLNVDQRDVTFNYVLPNPLHPQQVTYEIKLEGFDDVFYSSDQRSVRYPRLPGGRYKLKLRARDGEGEWTTTTVINVTAEKKLIEYLWFRIVIGLFTVGSLILLNRYLVLQVKKEERLKASFANRLNEVQLQALRAQMNPHFLFNCLNSIKYYAISKSREETADYLSKFALLVRTILNNSKSHTVALLEELEAMKLYVEIENIRLEDKFDFFLEVDESIDTLDVRVPPMIFQPYVENAIWHGLMNKRGKGTLKIVIKNMGDIIQCLVEDNGIGRRAAREINQGRTHRKTSMGMQITADRISLIHDVYGIKTSINIVDLTNSKNEACGTRVIIEIPLISEAKS